MLLYWAIATDMGSIPAISGTKYQRCALVMSQRRFRTSATPAKRCTTVVRRGNTMMNVQANEIGLPTARTPMCAGRELQIEAHNTQHEISALVKRKKWLVALQNVHLIPEA